LLLAAERVVQRSVDRVSKYPSDINANASAESRIDNHFTEKNNQ
jgi:hypothetical protein